MHSGLRRLAGILLLAVCLTVAVTAELPVPGTLVGAIVALVVVDLTLRSPAGTAVLAVTACWLALVVPLSRMYPEGAYQGLVLALLALPVAVASLRLRGYVPWRSALWALAVAGLLTAALADLAPRLHAGPAWAGAVLVLAYRWDRARRVVAADSYDSGWVEEAAPAPVPVRAPVPEPPPAPPPILVPAPRPPAAEPRPSVAAALAELEDMIGLAPVKRQVRSIAASIEAAHLRAEAGVPIEKPLRHLVFAGPSGTGKTTVARTLATIFYAFRLLPSARVVEVHRADLVGEYLGATAIKTNEVVDSAVGGVLFVDEAYSLVNAGDGQADRFGNEAVQALLKRAEDDRDNLVIILAGYETEMDEFLDSNPGLASRFGTRVLFPSYLPEELLAICRTHTEARGDRLSADALDHLSGCFEEIRRRGIVDQLGNGRFVRSLAEGASRARDLRVVSRSAHPSAAELVTIRAEDVRASYDELTARYRGYAETPTLEEALGSLDGMIGLEPVKRQVHQIAAQLQVRRLRAAQGLPAQPPMRHFVFTGPPGTGKTSVARVLGRIFAALGLLSRPDVVEVSRADLVGEHLGATALKTNRVIDSALGGVLFVDEAYSLIGTGYSGGDAFGQEAVQTLLKRAEDDRDNLVVVLAGYPPDMERLLAANPGLASRFDTRVPFPSYGPDELLRIAVTLAAENGDHWADDALDDLALVFQRACGQGAIDTLGNARFARTVYERSCAARDVRVSALPAPTTDDLTTLVQGDIRGVE
ncbi:type VII secretion ATPase EccA [Actinocorallia herbida]|uniref:Type VII secretion ATPase EccA n=1 Tax=Actinocorallia herbida TaxID=58109 RepID=A0A3N1D7F5_9ACTN|nr:AAA family ATPase [Actinocorallia herbida]ROO89409.1 type VII secretion ATPase EccA [Actinocorallia herbida]